MVHPEVGMSLGTDDQNEAFFGLSMAFLSINSSIIIVLLPTMAV